MFKIGRPRFCGNASSMAFNCLTVQEEGVVELPLFATDLDHVCRLCYPYHIQDEVNTCSIWPTHSVNHHWKTLIVTAESRKGLDCIQVFLQNKLWCAGTYEDLLATVIGTHSQVCIWRTQQRRLDMQECQTSWQWQFCLTRIKVQAKDAFTSLHT